MSDSRKNPGNAALAARLQAKFLREIPFTRALGLRVAEYAGDELVVAAPLAPNVNDKGTAFAGSLNALMTLAGWGLLHLRLTLAGESCDIVIHRGEVEFARPVRSAFRAVASLAEGDWEGCLQRLRARGRGRVAVATRIEAAEGIAATMQASYVALRRNAREADR